MEKKNQILYACCLRVSAFVIVDSSLLAYTWLAGFFLILTFEKESGRPTNQHPRTRKAPQPRWVVSVSIFNWAVEEIR